MSSASLHDRRYRPEDVERAYRDATATLFAAFADRPTGGGWVCSHCVSDADRAELAGPVERLSPEVASRFARKSLTTWGGEAELARAVPRLLVLAAEGRLTVGRELLWSKLDTAGFAGWPEREREAVYGFLVAEWSRLLCSPIRPAHRAHRWLASVASLTEDLGPFLTAWDDAMGPLVTPAHQHTAALHLVDLLTSSPLRPDLPATMADVFGGDPTPARQVTGWLAGPGPMHELQRAATAGARTTAARRLNVAVERLRRFRAAAGATPSGA